MKLIFLLIIGIVSTLGDTSHELLEFKNSNIQFSSNVYQQLKKSVSGNFLVCPLSAEVALALVQTNARGETLRQLALGTNLPEDPQKILDNFAAVAPSLKGNDKYTFECVNKVYLKDKYHLHKDYEKNVVNIFNAEIQCIDFEKADEAALEINNWVSEKTHDKIKNLIDASDLNKYTRLILLNAVYFKGTWVTKFNEVDTELNQFYINSNQYININMMQVKSKFNYYRSDKYKAKYLELPYQGDDVTMTIVLPDYPAGLTVLEENLVEVLKEPVYRSAESVYVKLPKFKIETTIQFNEILKSLGAVLPFLDSADFRDIIIENEPLKISKVVQKTYIEVDEKGSVAAAATAVVMEMSRSAKALDHKVFIADHPFIFYIKHKVSGIVFIGRYSLPEVNV